MATGKVNMQGTSAVGEEKQGQLSTTELMQRLFNKDIQNYKLDVEILASSIINKSREYFLLNQKKNFTKKEFNRFKKFLKKRNNRQFEQQSLTN